MSASPATARPARAYRREPDEKRERILEAAGDVFADRGFTGSTTAEIAARANVSEGILFHHFGSKRDLFATVAAAYGRGLAEAMFGERPGAELVGPAESIQRAFGYVREHRDLHRVFLVRDPGPGEPASNSAREEIVSALEAVFSRGVEQGVMRAMDCRIAAELMYALVSGALESCFEIDAGSREEEYLRETIQCVAGALLPLTAPGRAPSTMETRRSEP